MPGCRWLPELAPGASSTTAMTASWVVEPGSSARRRMLRETPGCWARAPLSRAIPNPQPRIAAARTGRWGRRSRAGIMSVLREEVDRTSLRRARAPGVGSRVRAEPVEILDHPVVRAGPGIHVGARRRDHPGDHLRDLLDRLRLRQRPRTGPARAGRGGRGGLP